MRSPSKLNLFFRVLNKREDGYHEIASLYQAIDLSDTLNITKASTDTLRCSNSKLETPNNLILKAAALFRKKTGVPAYAQYDLEKKIPIGAGLGGGSGNAATTLWTLNELYDRPATTEQLANWAAEIGSDISFFFSTGTAYCTGRGEKLKSQPDLFSMPLYLALPPFSMSTPQVYGSVNLASTSSLDPQKILASFFSRKPLFLNDLEHAAFSLNPALEEYKKHLLSLGFDQVTMTGSGSAFFCTGEPRELLSNLFPIHFIQRRINNWY